jgi:RNA polymerase subunit RPABC4/transcription elongation factor Spt4
MMRTSRQIRDGLAAIQALKEKACTRCGVVKPNDLVHFGNKLFGDRHTMVPTEVCKACTAAKIANRWRRQRWDQYEYECFKAREAVRKARAERGEPEPEADPSQWTEADATVYDSLKPAEPDCPRPDPNL